MNHSSAITVILSLALLLPMQVFAEDGCRAIYGSGKVALTVATGSPGELGLLKAWIDAFNQQQPVVVCWRKAGSGASLRLLKARKVDLALVHAPKAEKQAVAQGWALGRYALGSNQFFIVGPKDDPAKVAGASSAAEAYALIYKARAKFVSRGDKSGTHKKELAIWKKAGLQPVGSWYLISKDFMMASLLMATRRGAYFMTDSSTWYVARAGAGVSGMVVLFKGDPMLINHYHALTPPAGATPGAALAKKFAEFISSPAGQAVMAAYGKKKYGHPLYLPAKAN